MIALSEGHPGAGGGQSRRLVQGLFACTCLLSVVSWYTTWQGMALYLSGWFALLASLGVQCALVLVAWLVGLNRERRPLLIAVYAITAAVSIGFSYVSLYTWFAVRERPAQVQRQLYDAILASAGAAGRLLTDAQAEAGRHVLALTELTEAERSHGHIARAQDSDPYLAQVRAAVAQEAQSLGGAYQEGAGGGVRHAAFARHTRLAQQTQEQLAAAQRGLAAFVSQLRPLDPADQQIRQYRAVHSAIPWAEVAAALHGPALQIPPVPAYGEHLDHTASGQEDLVLAIQELFRTPTARHLLAFTLAAFIDIVVFLLAYGAGPHFAGSPEGRWLVVSATLDAVDPQVFARTLLRKLDADQRGLARVELAQLSAGERQFCLLLAAHRGATLVQEAGRRFYLLDERVHAFLMEGLATPNLALRAVLQPS